MGFDNTRLLESLEQWRATAFLIAGVLFVVNGAIVVVHMSAATEPGAFAQAVVGASWTAAFIGLLGFYPSLAEQNHWLARVGAVFAVLGGIAMAVMAITMLGYGTNILRGDPGQAAGYFLLGIFPGIVLGFGLFSVASFRTPRYVWSIGLFLLIPPLTFLFNLASGIAGFGNLTTVFGVVSVLAFTMLAIGYQLRTGRAHAERDEITASGGVRPG